MTKNKQRHLLDRPLLRVDVVESGMRSQNDWIRCEIGTNLEFNTAQMESYFFARWEPVLYDAMLVAAAVEFCDRSKRRPVSGWGRDMELRIPVHELDRWNCQDVMQALRVALEFLSGDSWKITFYARKRAESPPRQSSLCIPSDVAAVIPFSDGLDSRSVAGIMALELGERLVRVRLGPTDSAPKRRSPLREPFTSVPYKVCAGERRFPESSARSRGFKFALLSGLAAYLAKAARVVVPESGQGALGSTLVPVGQAYADYRNHPMFTVRMERFFAALLGHQVRYEFPQLWRTKGETLARFVRECEEGPSSWASTWSCWQQSRQSSVEGMKRQCGICAACMLRRLSVHTAGLTEPKTAYVWENLGALSFVAGAAASFAKKRITKAMNQYAIAGALHLDHLAALRQSPSNALSLSVSAFQLSQACSLPKTEAHDRLTRLLTQHETEWKNFVGSLGPKSFIAEWAVAAR